MQDKKWLQGDGVPISWEEAYKIEADMNGIEFTNAKETHLYIKEKGYDMPVWDFDCNFKLDYDGPILKISSRFYPPVGRYGGDSWDGDVSVYIVGKLVSEKRFDCPTLIGLKSEVEKYVKSIIDKVKNIFNNE